MKTNLLEHIILYVIVVCIGLIIATLIRILVMAMGFDNFTTFMVFVVVLAIQVVIYLSIHVVLQNLMLPWIGNGLAKIPYIRKKIESRQIPIIEKVEVIETTTEEEHELSAAPERFSLEDIRNEQRQKIAKKQEDKQNIAQDYTRKSFVLYLSDEHLDVLCRNILMYITNSDMKELKPVKVKELTALDLRHFGWNIWNYFKPRNQMDIAYFLKISFPDIFKETEVESIKRHLKDDELKGIIKIKESLSE